MTISDLFLASVNIECGTTFEVYYTDEEPVFVGTYNHMGWRLAETEVQNFYMCPERDAVEVLIRRKTNA